MPRRSGLLDGVKCPNGIKQETVRCSSPACVGAARRTRRQLQQNRQLAATSTQSIDDDDDDLDESSQVDANMPFGLHRLLFFLFCKSEMADDRHFENG